VGGWRHECEVLSNVKRRSYDIGACKRRGNATHRGLWINRYEWCDSVGADILVIYVCEELGSERVVVSRVTDG
jgi:hypothetical protein